MTNNPAIIYASTIDGQGGGQTLEGDDVSQLIKDKQLAWVHLDGNNPSCREFLETELTYLDYIIIDALLAEETRPRALEFDEGVMLILRGVNLNEDSQPEDMISIRIWIDAHRIISVQKRNLKATADIQQRLIEGKGPKNAGEFLVDLSARLFERMEPIFSELDESLDNVEEKVLDTPDSKDRQAITDIRKKAIIFRRYITPQKDVMQRLKASELSWLDDHHKRKLQESYDRLIRYVEDLDTIRERAQIVKDELANILADKMNKNMYVLSVIAAIFLPLGFLTGLLGINVGGIPGTESEDAFTIFSIILAIVVLFQVILFKKMKWF